MKFLLFAMFLLLFVAGFMQVMSALSSGDQTTTSPTVTYAARTDFAVVPLPNPVPNIGSATGVGNLIVDPDFNTKIYRLTDIGTIPGRFAPQQEWANCGGWADWRISNLDSTKMFICNAGGGTLLLPFDPSTGKPGAARALPGSVAGLPQWSKTEKDVAFGLARSQDPEVVRIDFGVSPPKVTSVVNLARLPNCAQQFSGKAGWRELSTSWDGSTVALAVGTGYQDSAHTVYVWNANIGCQVYDSQAGTLNGTPVSGPSESFSIHSVKVSGDGKVVMVGPGQGSDFRHFWRVGTREVDTARANVNVGHFAMGYRSFLNSTGRTSDGKLCDLGLATRLLTSLSSPHFILTSKQCGDTAPRGDDHASWNNDDSTDRQPFATSTVTVPLGSPIVAAWQNEVLVFMPDGTVHREAHTFNSGKAKFFSCQYAIGTISQDGKWFFFSSDWEGTLGTDSAGNSRCDDFAVELH
jgi:hypothetical protein